MSAPGSLYGAAQPQTALTCWTHMCLCCSVQGLPRGAGPCLERAGRCGGIRSGHRAACGHWPAASGHQRERHLMVRAHNTVMHSLAVTAWHSLVCSLPCSKCTQFRRLQQKCSPYQRQPCCTASAIARCRCRFDCGWKEGALRAAGRLAGRWERHCRRPGWRAWRRRIIRWAGTAHGGSSARSALAMCRASTFGES